MEDYTTQRSSHRHVGGKEVEVQAIEFLDKRLLFVRVNGEADTTFDVKAPDANTMLQLSLGAGAMDFTCEKTCLIGIDSNLKLSILVNQIAKLLYSSSESRNLIISLSSKIFSLSNENSEDFDMMMSVLELIKSLN